MEIPEKPEYAEVRNVYELGVGCERRTGFPVKVQCVGFGSAVREVTEGDEPFKYLQVGSGTPVFGQPIAAIPNPSGLNQNELIRGEVGEVLRTWSVDF